MIYLGEIHFSDIHINVGNSKISLWVTVTSLGLNFFFFFNSTFQNTESMQSFHKPSRGFLQTIVKAAFDLEVNWVLSGKEKGISSYSQRLEKVLIYTGEGEALKQVRECWMKASTQIKPKRKNWGPEASFDSEFAKYPRKRQGKATRTNKRREYWTQP